MSRHIKIVTFGAPDKTQARFCGRNSRESRQQNMKLKQRWAWTSVWGGLVLGLVGMFAAQCQANVYPSDVRLNGGSTNVTALPGDTLTISYVLNEPASLGATVQILSGTTVVQTLDLPAGVEGTLRGFNFVNWEATNVSGGTYSVSVTAATSGYTNWTEITSDNDINCYALDGRGIAVDQNPSSPYYGRIFVANSTAGLTSAPGDTVGILKFNADTSDAEEGISSAGLDGHFWSDQGISPWKLEVSADDNVYVEDLVNNGDIYRWDPTMSSNSMLHVLRQDNQPPGSVLSGPAVTGAGSSTRLWLVDTNAATILKWTLTSQGVCASNDTGSLVVVARGASNLLDVAVDSSGNMYACANVSTSGDPSPRVFRFHAYDPSTNGNMPEATADWAVGQGDDTYAGASGIAVDPTGTYLAVAFQGPEGGGTTNGNTKILWATNGAPVVSLDLGALYQGFANHGDTDCAWDAVGNVYYIDNYLERWHIFSPPGTNQATTVASASIQIGSTNAPPPSGTVQIQQIAVSGGKVIIDFTAATNATAASFSVIGAATVTGPYVSIAGAQITRLGPGQFQASFPISPAAQYFRIAGQGGTPPPSGVAFSSASVSGGKIVLTFTGASSDTTSSFTILTAPLVNGAYVPNTSATLSALGAGVFQATLPLNGAAQFYRVRK